MRDIMSLECSYRYI